MLLRKTPVFLLLYFSAGLVYGQDRHLPVTAWETFINLRSYLIPFWKCDTVYDEITQVVTEDSMCSGTLLFRAGKIITVKSADQQTTFRRKKDWELRDGKIIIPVNSAIPSFRKDELFFTEEKQGWSMKGKLPGTFVLFSESDFFRSKQIAVTYIPVEGERWSGPVPSFAREILSHTIGKLQNREVLKIVFYGNSIEVGYNTSALQHQSPFMPSWPELIAYDLEQLYHSRVNFSNPSVGGKMAEWGKENAACLVVAEHPDLVVIGFGMNDGSAGIPPEKYIADIKGIIYPVRAQNPNAEFILIAPMLPNPLAIQSGIQKQYKAALDALQGKGILVADLTGVHVELLKHKRYQDMTGNNVNHPNDYLARWYAQFICGFLINP